MDDHKLLELKGRLEILKREAEALAAEKDAFPALWRNAERVLACVRMMEIGLGPDLRADKEPAA
ncbi:MAG: hypothetical protein AB1641_24505 [Thermodesulfobacteriota bacterium]